MIVVSDTSPVLALTAIERLDLLRLLFVDVIMPEAVDREITRKNPAVLPLPSWLRSQRVSDRGLVNSLLAEIDLAEAEAIVLAIELKDRVASYRAPSAKGANPGGWRSLLPELAPDPKRLPPGRRRSPPVGACCNPSGPAPHTEHGATGEAGAEKLGVERDGDGALSRTVELTPNAHAERTGPHPTNPPVVALPPRRRLAYPSLDSGAPAKERRVPPDSPSVRKSITRVCHCSPTVRRSITRVCHRSLTVRRSIPRLHFDPPACGGEK